MGNQRSHSEKQNIDRLLLALNIPTYIIHHANEAAVSLDEYILALRVQLLAFGCNAIPGFLLAADEVGAGAPSMLDELLEGCCPDAVGGADEDADEICGEGEGDLGVGEVDGGEGDHCVVLTDR